MRNDCRGRDNHCEWFHIGYLFQLLDAPDHFPAGSEFLNLQGVGGCLETPLAIHGCPEAATPIRA
jgi:hypothetical protein